MSTLSRFVRTASTLTCLAWLSACGSSPHAQDASSQDGSERRLQSEEILAIVAATNPRVQSECWQPSLEQRPLDAPVEAKVMAHFTITTAGHVEGAKVDEAQGYPRLASCIRSIVEQLTFPASAVPTTVNVPFVLNAADTQVPATASDAAPEKPAN